MLADTLAQQLLDRGYEWFVGRKWHTGKGDIRCLQATRQGADVEAIGRWDLLDGDFLLPEVVGNLRLGDAVGVDLGVGPCRGAVAVDERPVALHVSVTVRELWTGEIKFDIRSKRACHKTSQLHCDSLLHVYP